MMKKTTDEPEKKTQQQLLSETHRASTDALFLTQDLHNLLRIPDEIPEGEIDPMQRALEKIGHILETQNQRLAAMEAAAKDQAQALNDLLSMVHGSE